MTGKMFIEILKDTKKIYKLGKQIVQHSKNIKKIPDNQQLAISAANYEQEFRIQKYRILVTNF